MNNHNITNDNYFDRTEYMSVSRWKKLNKCELDGIQPFDDSNTSTALMVGQYVDAFVEGTLQEFKDTHPEIISSRGKTKGNLKAEFRQATLVCDEIRKDDLIGQFLSGDKQTIMVGEINTVPFKIKIDSYSKGIAISDLKVMRSITDSNGDFYDFISKWGYDVQLACYQEIVYQNTGEKLPCYIVALTKENPINKAVIQIPQSTLDTVLYEVEQSIIHYYGVYTGKIEPVGCNKCKTCIGTRKTPLLSMDELV